MLLTLPVDVKCFQTSLTIQNTTIIKYIYIHHYHLISFINLFTLINDRHQLIDQLIVLMDDKPGLISGHKALVRNFQNHDFRCISPRPNHCGRHLGKINGHNSTYVKVWRCTFGRITRVLKGKSWGKLL